MTRLDRPHFARGREVPMFFLLFFIILFLFYKLRPDDDLDYDDCHAWGV